MEMVDLTETRKRMREFKRMGNTITCGEGFSTAERFVLVNVDGVTGEWNSLIRCCSCLKGKHA
jgi:hypothetical protein